MIRNPSSWLRTCAVAVAGFALVFGAALSAHALSLVGVYQKSGFEYVVNLGSPSSLTPGTTIPVNANIASFGGSTAGALFSIVGVVDRNMQDEFGVPVSNIIFTKTGTFPVVTYTGIGQAQNLVAGQGAADSWFDLIPSIASGALGANLTQSATAPTAYAVKVAGTSNDFFGAFSFSTVGTIDSTGNLRISLYSAVQSDAFTGAPQSVNLLANLHVTPTGIVVPEPASILAIGLGLAGIATLRRRA